MLRARKLVPHRLIAATATLSLAAGLVVVAPPADAATYPNRPHGAKVRAIGSSSITIGAWHSHGARYYRLYVSRVRNDLYWENIHSSRSTRHMDLARQPVVTVAGLPTTAAPYYWRFATARHGHIRLGNYIGTFYLRPGAPSGFVARASSVGGYVAWTSRPATAYQILGSTDSAMRGNRRLWTVRAPASQFTPYGLNPGTRYYFKIQALSGATPSGWSAAVAMTPAVAMQPVRVATYNILYRGADGTTPAGSERIADWDTSRRPAASALLHNADAEVIAIQEGEGKKPGNYRNPRQVDTLASTLGSNYVVAHTESVPDDPGYSYILSGSYIIYRSDLFKPIGAGGHWTSHGHILAAYQMLQRRSSGARFLMVSVHLTVGQGYSYDVLRQSELRDVATAARTYAHARGVSAIVYGGDTNSTYARWHTFDGPTNTAVSTGLADAYNVAQYHYNSAYASYNKYQRVAQRGLGSIDRIFADPTVGIVSWGLLLNVDRSGRFVGTIPSDHNALQSTVTVPIVDFSS